MKFLKRFALLLIAVGIALLLSSCTDQKQVYEEATALFESGEYLAAAEKLDGIPGYEDSASLARYCEALAAAADGDVSAASDLLNAVPADFRDTKLRKAYYEAASLEVLAENGDAKLDAAAAFDRVPGFLDADERAVSLRQSVFDDAKALLDVEKYDDAYGWLEKLGSFNGAEGMIDESKFTRGEKAVEMGDLALAYELFASLGEYRNAAEKCTEVRYLQGVEAAAEGRLDEAWIYFHDAGDWKDARAQASACMERVAETLSAEGDPAQALAIYVLTGNTEKLYETVYAMAGQFAAQGKIADAARIYRLLGDFGESAEKLAMLPEAPREEAAAEAAEALEAEAMEQPDAQNEEADGETTESSETEAADQPDEPIEEAAAEAAEASAEEPATTELAEPESAETTEVPSDAITVIPAGNAETLTVSEPISLDQSELVSE